MSYDVVVVGGGIGGLTVAALLSARGLSTCLLERQSQVGGCVARIELAGHNFDPGMGLYSGWEHNGIHERVFSELPVPHVEVSRIESEYVVRLDRQTDVRLCRDDSTFFAELRRVFPECAETALEFYQTAGRITENWQRAHRTIGPGTSGMARKFLSRWSQPAVSSELRRASERTALDFADKTSPRFQAFLNAQLRSFSHTTLESSAFLPASLVLTKPRQTLFGLKGGPAGLAECLAESITKSGGKVRLDSPVLRLAYDKSGKAVGVDMLSGETVFAKQAIVSNLTVWDTYGKLIGLNKTSSDIKKTISAKRASGAYLVYASMEEAAVDRLPSTFLLCAASRDKTDDEEGIGEFTFVSPSPAYLSAPAGKRAVTIKTETDVTEWFTFQSSNEEYEQWDQAALERVWERLHHCLPELGGDIEVIDTATPRTFYDLTRRKLGMVLGVEQTPEQMRGITHQTSIPNLFIVGDTVSTVASLEAITQSALNLANVLAPSSK